MSKLAALALVLITACATSVTKNTEPQILSTSDTDISYKVRINFVVFESEAEQYPEIDKQFRNAVATWAEKLPIEIAVYQQEQISFFSSILGHPVDVAANPRNIKIHYADLQGSPYHMTPDTLGVFNHKTKELIIDDELEQDHDRAYAVCLHELGHAFGLQHFVDTHDLFADTGDLVISNARNYIMYPNITEQNECANLSDLEISLARKYVLQLTDGAF